MDYNQLYTINKTNVYFFSVSL